MTGSGAVLSVYRIKTAETFWAIATSEHEAIAAIQAVHLIDDWATVEDFIGDEEPEITRLAYDAVIAIDDEEVEDTQTKTCAEWIQEKGAGFLCSTVY